MSILHRIVATWRVAAEDPKTLFPRFEQDVENYLDEVSEEDLAWLRSSASEVDVERTYKLRHKLMMFIMGQVSYKLQRGAPLFQAILQAYELPRALGSKIEAANRFFNRSRRPTIPKKTEELVEAAQTIRNSVRGFMEAARTAIREGKTHQEGNTRVPVGPFVLVNLGGFSSGIMETMQSLVEQTTHLLTRKGFQRLCYGDIQITKTITKASTLAFYQLATDEMFIRANAPKKADTLQTILHELGHRLENKFMQGRQSGIEKLYDAIARAGQAQREESYPLPTRGDSITLKGETLYVIRVEYSPNARGHYMVLMDLDPKATKPGLKTPLAAYSSIAKGETRRTYAGPFVSQYAQTGGPSENFAEMFAFYCMDKLPGGQVDLLMQVLP